MSSQPAYCKPVQIHCPGFEISSTDTVVDVGCGAGDVCVYAAHLGAAVIGIDIEECLVDQTRRNMANLTPRSFQGIVSDCDPIPLPDATADVVVCTEVLEHVPDPAKLLSELARIGKPGARYLISVPHPASESVMRKIAPEWYWQPPFHIHVYEPDQLDSLIAQSGLKVETRHNAGFYWSMFWFLQMAAGMDHPYRFPENPMLAAWDEVATGLASTEKGKWVLESLDSLVPKSQVRLATKVVQPQRVDQPSSLPGPIRSRSRLKRAVRDGSLRLGHYALRWSVRRA